MHLMDVMDVMDGMDLMNFDEFDGFDGFDRFRAECRRVLARVVMRELVLWGGYGSKDRLNHRSLLQNIVSFIGLFCKRDPSFNRSY